ncbi:hypothetical protein LTR16_009833, partial [Cryomyces antarcticus]
MPPSASESVPQAGLHAGEGSNRDLKTTGADTDRSGLDHIYSLPATNIVDDGQKEYELAVLTSEPQPEPEKTRSKLRMILILMSLL